MEDLYEHTKKEKVDECRMADVIDKLFAREQKKLRYSQSSMRNPNNDY